MLFKIIETSEVYDVRLKEYNLYDDSWSPDLWADLSTEWYELQSTDDGEYLIKQDDFTDMVEWWRNEIDNFNNDVEYISDVFGSREDYNEYYDPDNYFQLFVKKL